MTTRKITIAAMAIASAGLAACACFKAEEAKTTKDCTHAGQCEVDVVVKDCVPATAEVIRVDKSGPPVQIRWRAPAGYLFTRQGIELERSLVIEAQPGFEREGESWTVIDRPNGQKVTTKYRLQVKSASSPGTVCTGPDPVIINE
jgi:hypothetical protein